MLYRITPAERDKIKAFQAKHPQYKVLLAKKGKRDVVDHSHATGELRGILEWRLNKGFGLIEKAFPENLPEVLRALAEYCEHFPVELALGEKRYGLIGLAKANKKHKVYGPPQSI